MKKIFTLLLSSLFSLSLLAFDGSRLSISAPGTSTELKIEIDGRKFTMKNNSITAWLPWRRPSRCEDLQGS